MTSLIMVVGEQIKCFLSSLCNAHANVAEGQWIIVGGLAHVTRCQKFRIIRTCTTFHTSTAEYYISLYKSCVFVCVYRSFAFSFGNVAQIVFHLRDWTLSQQWWLKFSGTYRCDLGRVASYLSRIALPEDPGFSFCCHFMSRKINFINLEWP